MKRFLGNAIFGSQKMPRTTSNGNLPESPPPCLFPEGIQVWHDCPDAVVDVCFIHGLTGDRNSTWTAHGQSTPWPKSLLPPKLRGARILTYGYDAYIMRGSVASGNRLIDHASDFLNDLTTNRDSHDASNRSLIFVAHSLGGLVCKEAILLSRDRTQDHHLRGIFNHTKGIIFMGTPHQGSWMADWAGIPVSALGIGKSTSKSLLEILQTDNQFLEAIQEGFLTLIRNSEKAGKPLEVICFFEALPLPGWGPVVTKKSATFESYDWISLHANHRDMVKFVSAEDNGFIVVMKNAAVQQDIANYIGDELQDHTVLYRYEERHREIRNLISERSQCAFRYAFSLFSHIGSAAGLSHLDELMSSLPSSLDAAYEDILSKIPKVHSNYAGRILRILCLSNRPLTVDELVHALAVDLGQKKCLDIERLFHINELRNLLGCLIECTWEKGLFIQGCITIQIAHTSVREYLRSDKIRQQSTVSMFAIEHGSTHMEIAQTCLLYILDPKISQGAHTQDKLISFPFASYAAKEWLYHYTRSDTPSSVVQELVVKLFTDQSGCFNTWIELRDLGSSWKAAADLTDATDSSATPLYHACLLGLADIVAKLVTIYNVNAPGGRYGNALQAAISQGHIEVVRNLLDGNLSVDSGGENLKSTEPANLSERQVTKIQTLPKPNISIDVNARGGEYGTSLIAACYNGNVELVLMLLRKGSNVNDQVGQYGNALAAASLRGHKRVVQLLLEKKAHFNASACGGRYGNALIAASNAGHSEIVQTLLSLDKNAISYSRSELFGNAFHAASFGGHTNILQDLLNFGADINAEDGIYGTALGSACFRGHMSAVQILVNYGAKINASSGRFGNALQAASLGGHIDLVKYLLDEGAKVNASGGRFGNALQAASFGTHDSMAQSIQHVLKDMLSRGVPILPQNSNALQVASSDAYRWDEKTLEKLSEMVLSKLPNAFSTMDPGKRDPFLDASLTDRGPLVQLLLEKGADVNAAGGEYGSALQAASSQGLETVVEILLNAKADVQASGGIHGSALELASYQNHEGIMKMLQNASSGLRPDGSSC
ncbi:hypothetical protein N7519_000237 [Penicillium mononematosum]|uniref:uncharacterized protein n=1 Tax=Penicillium mononematosum TaxID=268346 RepID=UPI002547474E|nr:uncharacterized protein N7519_000237 [Penicillium mononematosum]KAJ6190216.1 hypothetical protein N7519_000237 [Penicillium mononematosum]